MHYAIRIGLMLAIMLVLSVGLASLAAAAESPAGRVELVTGSVSLLRGGASSVVKTADPVLVDDTLTTAPDGHAVVRFADDTLLVLGQSSKAKIDTYVYGGPSSRLLFKFAKGSFRAITGKIVQVNPQAFNMQTPLATLGIRGSDVFALVAPETESIGALELGPGHSLEVQSQKGAATIREAGLFSRVTPDGLVAAPQKIPPAMLNAVSKTLSTPLVPPISTTPVGTLTPAPALPQLPPVTTTVTPPRPPAPPPTHYHYR